MALIKQKDKWKIFKTINACYRDVARDNRILFIEPKISISAFFVEWNAHKSARYLGIGVSFLVCFQADWTVAYLKQAWFYQI